MLVTEAAHGQVTRSVDLAAARIDAPLPFHRGFRLRVPVPKEVVSIDLAFFPAAIPTCDRDVAFPCSPGGKVLIPGPIVRTPIELTIPPLPPDMPYVFRFTLTDTQGRVQVVDVKATATTTLSDKLHTDIGVYGTTARQLDFVGAGTSLHLFLGPTNADIELNYLTRFDQITRRVSVFAGFATKLHSKSGTSVEAVLPFGSPVVGVGFWPISDGPLRFARHLRLSYGMMWFQQESANPLIDSKITKHVPVASVSFDAGFTPALASLAALLGAKK
jgi:hypothetical protein